MHLFFSPSDSTNNWTVYLFQKSIMDELDPLRDDSVAYVRRLAQAGVRFMGV